MIAQPKRMRRGRWFFFAGAGVCLACGVVAAKVVADYRALDRSREPAQVTTSKIVLDRNGRLLRAFTTPDEKWRLPVSLGDVDPIYWKMLKAYEDRRFDDHGGIDLRALVRAGAQFLWNGRIVSGGSTLTMQVARLLEEQPTRSLAAKYQQLLQALRLEQELSKDEILQLYALRAPFGGNLEGIRAASLTWFGKEPKRLTPAEAALLVALPQSPEARRPDRHGAASKRARDRVLERAVLAGVLTQDDSNAAQNEVMPTVRRPMPFLAAHVARSQTLANPDVQQHRLTLDADLQSALESLLKTRVEALGPKRSAAIIVVDHATGEILASVGSPDLLNEDRLGHVDMTEAVRSPGSTLKPLIYGLAFEEGVAHPESLIDDRPIDIGGYRPTNFDLAYQGRVSIRKALQLSLNTPAIQLLEAVGPARLLARMKRSGAEPVIGGRESPGLAIGLGGLGLTLRELTGLYASLANGGRVTPLYLVKDGAFERQPLRLLDEVAAWHVADVLTGLPQPRFAADTHLAYKTGTAYGYRDAWAVGFDGRHVIGVWVGRVDGTPLPGMTGADAAVPILFDAFQRVKPMPSPLPRPPRGTLNVAATELPRPLRVARVSSHPDTGESLRHEPALEIAYPPDASVIDLGLAGTGERQPLVVKIRGGLRPYTWLVDDLPVAERDFRSFQSLTPLGPGSIKITVLDRTGASASVEAFLR